MKSSIELNKTLFYILCVTRYGLYKISSVYCSIGNNVLLYFIVIISVFI